MKESKLSKTASAMIDELQRKMEQVINADKIREPKLTPEEKAEIASLETEALRLSSIVDQLVIKLETARARLQYLERNYIDMVTADIEIAEKTALELIQLPSLLDMLETVHRSISMAKTTASMRIDTIKDQARRREVEND